MVVAGGLGLVISLLWYSFTAVESPGYVSTMRRRVGALSVLLLVAACGGDDAVETAAGSGGRGGMGATASSTGSGAGSVTSGGGGGGDTVGDGIAARYPGDVDIVNDPDVVFADDFESYGGANDLGQRWDAVYQQNQLVLTTNVDDVWAGSQSLEMNVPQQQQELSNAVDKILTIERDELFLRFYSKYEAPFDVVGSSHNGAMIAAHYFDNGQATPGIPADGTNKFLVNLEHWRGEVTTTSPGELNVYVYHPEQRSNYGDHFFPDGTVLPNSSLPFDFGPDFVSRPNVIQELDRWYCYEYRVRANTPGMRDGQITIWIDGVLVADFPNLRLRDDASLTIDRFGLQFHIGSNPNGPARKWFDNVVAATAYIGPMSEP